MYVALEQICEIESWKGLLFFLRSLSVDCLLLMLQKTKTNGLFFKLKMCDDAFLSSRALGVYKLFWSPFNGEAVTLATLCFHMCMYSKYKDAM